MSWTQYSHKYSVIRSCHLPSKWPRVQSFYVTMCLLEKTVTASLQCQACSLSRICPSNFQGFVPVKSRNLSQWRCLANPGGIQLERVKIYDCKCCVWSFRYFIIFLWWLTNWLATLGMVIRSWVKWWRWAAVCGPLLAMTAPMLAAELEQRPASKASATPRSRSLGRPGQFCLAGT